MKKIIFTFATIFVLMTGAFAQNQRLTIGQAGTIMNESVLASQNENQITIRFDLNQLDLVEVETNYGTAYLAVSDDAPLMLQGGFPELFYLTSTFIIPNEGNSELLISYGQYQDFNNVEIAPSKGNLPRSVDPQNVPFVKGSVYQIDEFYPGTLASLRDPFILRDIRGQSVDVYPVQYNPVTKVLRVYSEIIVTVNNTTSNGVNEIPNQRSNNTIDQQFNDIYNNLFINYSGNQTRGYPTEEEGELLIICHPSFMDGMQPYVDWKRTIGRKTTIVSTAITGTSTTSIKNYISNYYNNPDNNLAYVLLVGDSPQIPPYAYTATVYSDLYYGLLAGNDPYLEVLIGRMSAQSVSDVKTQVERTIRYERDVDTSDTWINNGMGIAYNQGAGSGHDGGEADYVHMNNIRNRLLTYGYSIVHQDYGGNCPNVTNTTSAQISQRVDSGVGVINYCNHGTATGWSVANYSNSHVSSLTNTGKLPYIFSVACLNGQFTNSSPCFAEAWMRSQHNGQPIGAVATLMATISIAWLPPMTAQDEFNHLCLDIATPYGQSAGIKRTFAGTALNATQKMIMVHGTSGSVLNDFYSWTVFGDPTLMIRTKTPQSMVVTHPSTLTCGMNSLTIACNTDDAIATLSYLNDNNEVVILGKATVSGGTATIAFSTSLADISSLTLAVTGFNKVTYIRTLTHATSPPIVIQNNTIWSTNQQISNTVTIENNAVLTINAGVTVWCSPSAKFIVKPGGKLVVNGATLTNSCQGELWRGIEVWGTLSDHDQINSKQGMLTVTNGAIIENAVCGIYVGCRSLAAQLSGMGGGGVITAQNSTFRNNRISVEFTKFTRLYRPNIERPNRSFFEKCLFETDNNAFFAVTSFDVMVRLYGVRDIRFSGCAFVDSKAKSQSFDYGAAVYGYGSSVRLDGFGFMINIGGGFLPAVKNIFKGFGNAIILKNSGTKASKIEFADFTNNNVGIYANTSDKLSVISCNIDVNPLADLSASGRHGIYLEYCDGYVIENNVFSGDGIGMHINESGAGNNLIRYNTFDDMCLAIRASNINGGGYNLKSATGLQFKCNYFTGNDEDIRVSDEPESRIRIMQGTSDIGTGNYFHPVTIALRNTSTNYLFVYSYNQTIPEHAPIGYVANNNAHIGPHKTNQHTCPKGIGATGEHYYMIAEADPSGGLDKLGEIYIQQAEKLSVKLAEYKASYGETEINWEQLTESGADDFWAKPQVKLFTEIVQMKEDIQETCNQAFSIILSDTLFSFATHSTWLLRENKLHSDLLLAQSYIEQSDWGKAQQTLDDLRTRFPEFENDDYDLYLKYLHYQYQFDNKYPSSVTLGELSELEAFLLPLKGITRILMESLLNRLRNIITFRTLDNDCLVNFDDGGTTSASAGNGQKSDGYLLKDIQETIKGEYVLEVYPNPFNDVLQIRLDNATDLNMEQVSVYDISGRKLRTINDIGNIRTDIQLSDLSAGMYFIHVSLSNGETKVERIVKQ